MRIIPTCISLRRLKDLLGDDTAAKTIRTLMREGFETLRGYYHISHDVVGYLEAIEKHCPFSYGVESLYPDLPDIWYFNAGDTYAETLIYNSDSHRWSVGCWGDIVK